MCDARLGTGDGTIHSEYTCILIYNVIISRIWQSDEYEHKEGEKQTRWAKFSYVVRQTKFMTKSFKNYNIKVSFKTESTIGKLVAQNINIKPNKFINIVYIN